MSGILHITCEHLQTLHARKEKQHVIVDLRDTLEFESGHIEGSVNVPRKELETNLENVLPRKDKKVVVIVGPTHESEIGEINATIQKLGYSDVEFLAGGFDRWCEIAAIEIEPDLTAATPEEKGFVGDELAEIDPESKDNEPLL